MRDTSVNDISKLMLSLVLAVKDMVRYIYYLEEFDLFAMGEVLLNLHL